MKTKLTLLFALLISAATFAQNGINYKAQIKDASGEILANQNVDIQFTILKFDPATVFDYQENHTAIATDSNGIITAVIGEGTPVFGDFATLDWGSASYFLSVQVDTGDGLVDMGTTPFGLVPYAATALNALNITGLEKISENGSSGFRLIGKNPLAYGDIGTDAVDLSNSTGGASTDHGATGVRSFAAGQNTIASGGASAAIGFEGEATGVSAIALGYVTKADALGTVAVGTYNIGGGNPTQFDSENPIFEVGNGMSSGARRNALTVLQNGNVGIGKHSGMNSQLEIEGNSNTDGVQLELIENNTGFSRMRFRNTSRNGEIFWDIAASAGATIADDKMNFFNSDGGNILSLKGDGKMGLGTSSPNGLLHIEGTSALGKPHIELTQPTIGDEARVVFNNAEETDNKWIVKGKARNLNSASRFTIDLPSANEPIFTATGDGRIGLGNADPAARLDVAGTIKANQIRIATGASTGYVLTSDAQGFASWQLPTGGGGGGAPDLDWLVGGSNMYTFSPVNVGIGTETPAEKLEVVGKIKATEIQLTQGAFPGHVLTAIDIDGNTSWDPVPASPWTVSNNQASVTLNIPETTVRIGNNLEQSDLFVDGNILAREGIIAFSSDTSSQSRTIRGISSNGIGIAGTSTNSIGVFGEGKFGGRFSSPTAEFGVGVIASAGGPSSIGVDGKAFSSGGIGVSGTLTATTGFGSGVSGFALSENGSGVSGRADGTNGTGIRGRAENGNGVGVEGRGAANGYDFYASGAGVDYGAASSKRWKSDVIEIDNPLEKLSKIRGVYYTWDEAHGGKHDLGMIAEEVGAVLPEIVQFEENGIDAIGMDYGKMTPLLVQIAKAQQKIIEDERAEVVRLKEQLEKMTGRFENLENRLLALESSNNNFGNVTDVKVSEEKE